MNEYGNNNQQPPYQNDPNTNTSNNGYSQNSGYSYQNSGYYGQQPNNGYSYYGNGGNPNGKPPKPVKNKPSKGKKTGVILLVTAICVCAALAITGVVLSLTGGADKAPDDGTQSNPGTSVEIRETPTASATTADGELTAAGVYERIKESSVGVLVYSDSRSASASGEGSGIILGEDATGTYTYIVTAAHVISDGGSVRVQLFDETQYEATILGYDQKTDVGVLQITASGLHAAELGDSDSVLVGETVYAIGNPGGTAFAGSFTNGMVSSILRPVNSETGYEMLCIQHTAAINPGNSGGALVNAYGQVIGVNSSKIASTDYEGMGFAVPSRTVKEVFDEIVAHGYVTNRPKLGITYTPASQSQMYSMIVSLKELPAGSLVVQSVSSDSSLANTDVKQGDMIIKANGKDLESADDLPDLIEDSKVGDTITLTICRIDSNYNISEFEVTATLVEDRGSASAEEATTRSSTYNPFGAYGYGN